MLNQPLIDFHFDKETQSYLNLSKVGAVNYVNHHSSGITLITWCFGRTGTIRAWRLGQPIPAELIHVAMNPHLYRFIAWNVEFDFLVWTVLFRKLVPALVRPQIENIEDAMALSVHFRTGASLESAAIFMKLPHNKDKLGRTLMLKQCKLNSKTGQFYELTPLEWDQFEIYGIMDTRILRDVYYMLPALPAPERWAFEWTFKRNMRGIRIDEKLVDELNSIVQSHLPNLTAEFNHWTQGKCTINSPVSQLPFFKPYYPWIENMQAETVRDMLDYEGVIPPHIKRALEIKDLAGSTSIAKIKTALQLKFSGRIYQILAYAYAQTKRWAGRGIQIQNFPRIEDLKDQIDKIDFDLNQHDITPAIQQKRMQGLKDPIGFVKNLLRRIWIPDPGLQFYCGDFSKVEPSVLLWLLDMGAIPKKWYEEMAAEIYNKPVDQIEKDSVERTVGKQANLSCQYGTGAKGFKKSVKKDTGIVLPLETAKQVVATYRKKNPKITQFWYDLEAAFRKAIHGETSSLCNGRVFVMPMEHPWKGVKIRLPSGGYLYYHEAHETTEVQTEEIIEYRNGVPFTYEVKKTKHVLKYLNDFGKGKVLYDYVYGGVLCENVVSSIAREIMVPAMWRLDNAGFDVLGCIHDEIWAQALAGREDEFKYLMCINPSWCDMKIDSDLKCGRRYLK